MVSVVLLSQILIPTLDCRPDILDPCVSAQVELKGRGHVKISCGEDDEVELDVKGKTTVVIELTIPPASQEQCQIIREKK